MTPRIVHVLTAPSFAEFVCSNFEEVAPGANIFVCVGFDPDRLPALTDVRVEAVPGGRAGHGPLNSLVAESDIAIFHSVTIKTAAALASVPNDVLRVWSGWGWDYYGSTSDPLKGQLGPLTRRWAKGETPVAKSPWKRALTVRSAQTLHAAARSADVFSAPIPEDFEVFRRRFRGFQGRYGQLNYLSVEDTLRVGPDQVTGSDILLGNSASATNNHFEVLGTLATTSLGDSRVIVPLSYGDPQYKAAVIDFGRELLGDKFFPLLEPLPLDQYHALMAGCRVVVMGHWRQQGVGNVLRAVWQGAHIVLDPRNPVSGYLRARGIAVYSLGDVDLAQLATEPAPASQVEAHREVLVEHWGRETVLRNIRDLISLAE